MRAVSLGVRNVLRNRFRTALTILGVAVAILAFVLLRTVLSAWTVAADHAAQDRIVTRHKVSFIMTLPIKYVSDVKAVPGIKSVSYMSWFGGKDPNHEQEFFGSMAVDAKTAFEVYDEVIIPPEQTEAWLQDRRGIVIGDVIAKKLGYKVGDKLTLRGTIYPGDWQFIVSGIYTTKSKAIDRTSMWFHYEYLNEWARENMPEGADQVGWLMSRIDKGHRPVDVAQRIDRIFEDRDVQTLTQDERSFNTSFLGMISAVLKALDIVSIVILVIMMLILGNTIAMGVRERTHEYGMLRAIGFLPKHLVMFVIGEAATVGFLGGAFGLLISFPIVEQGLGRFLEENMGSFFPYFRIDSMTPPLALGLAVLLGVCASLVPAYRASQLDVASSLRKIG